MRKILLSLAFLLITSFACATDFTVPDQKITGADNPVPVGEAIELSVNGVKDKPVNYVSSSYVWKVYCLPEGKEKVEKVRSFEDKDGSQGIFFGGGITSKSFLVNCYVTHLYAVKAPDGKVTEVATRNLVLSVKVLYGDPSNPKPPDVPPDSPTFNDGKYKLEKFSYDNFMSVNAAVRSQAASILSTSFTGTASMVKAGVLKTPQEALKKALENNQNALNGAKPPVPLAELDKFVTALQDQIYSLYQSKQLKTVDDYATAFNEIAAGLKKIK